MTDDPAVRSVRVAAALCERMAELLKGPQAVSAAKQSGALFGVSGNESELSLRIGEAQQIYPEIWRHLDDARAAFAGRGADLAAYDQIRAAEGTALGAAVDVKAARRGVGQHAVDEWTKSANFNRAGLARAKQASQALMRATPDIDWAGIARAEAADPEIAAFGRATRRKRWLRLALLAAVLAAPFAYVVLSRSKPRTQRDADTIAMPEPLDDAARAELEAAIARARAVIGPARASWPAAVAKDALAGLAPGRAPCEHRFSGPTAAAAESFVQHGSIDANYFGSGMFASYAAGEPIPDDQLAGTAQALDVIAQRAAAGRATAADRELVGKLPSHVVFFVIDREVQPEVGPGASYMPGAVIGRSFVYSVAARKIVCAGAVDARNPPALATTGRAREVKQMLMRDLEVRIRQALAAGLAAI